MFSHVGVPSIDGTPSGNQSLGTEFSLSAAAALTGIWFFTPTGATHLPGNIAIYTVTGKSQVAGTLVNAPSWSGSAGSQSWVKHTYDGSVTLAAGTNYRLAIFCSNTTAWAWNTTYWSSGAGSGGLVSGIISAPGSATAGDGGAQVGNATGASLAYPGSTASTGANVWMDIEVTVASGGPAGAVAALAATGML